MTIFAIENEAIHNKDYSVVKTSRAGLRTRSFFLNPEKHIKTCTSYELSLSLQKETKLV